MSLQAAYKQYLAAPNSSFLADNATLHYVTTLTTVHGPTEIIKHLNSQSKKLKKEEETIDIVEGNNAIVAEVKTTLEFLTGGGAYLPGIDDNFLSDRVVTFPVIHIVAFDADRKITEVRQTWDQGSLLKLIEVIGKTGRNWPIKDGKDQIKLIQSSVLAAARQNADVAPVATRKNSSNGSDDQQLRRSRENSNNVTRDPHASLALFAPREEQEETNTLPAAVAPRASAKPPPRDYGDLFVGQDSPSQEPLTPSKDGRPSSPFKHAAVGAIAPKAGGAKKFQPSRIFEAANDEDPSAPRPNLDPTRESFYKPNPKKFSHFDIASGTEPESAAAAHPKPKGALGKNGPNWNFDDFSTPAKTVPTKTLAHRAQDDKHWGNEDEQVVDTPVRKAPQPKPRKDAETHFEFKDDGTPQGERRLIGRPKGTGHNTGLGLYENNLYDEDGRAPKGENKPLTNLANVKDRKKDFDPHFAFADESPMNKAQGNQKENLPLRNRSTSPNRKALEQTTNKAYDKSQGINIGGDGMGGRKGAGRAWGFGDESEDEAPAITRKGHAHPQAARSDFWDF